MQTHICTVEGAAQNNLSVVLPFWIAEEWDGGEESLTLLLLDYKHKNETQM